MIHLARAAYESFMRQDAIFTTALYDRDYGSIQRWPLTTTGAKEGEVR
jgi:hypothetical protein